ncbi:hypothetical protein SKAU_G00096500 [Synaphobranchus kaupii]|uniref:Transglutaminase N-terminal domain-containing protein n=1 Tax=Synaphobranchus kaupii TaxID=118154 RepID=A0A9Q1FYA1_SYNKA|nr:hypothetical protein SKAU_G00096500 [Synaphobranchus kaupii]
MTEALDIGSCDLEFKKNNEEHHTDLNGVDRLIVRRGQPFTITLNLRSGTFQPGVSTFQLIAETGPDPEEQWGYQGNLRSDRRHQQEMLECICVLFP